MSEASIIRGKIQTAKALLESLERELNIIIRNCPHSWGSTQYDPIIREAYTDPGDAPGTCGIDWRGPVEIPCQETKRWTRKCALCLKEEATTMTKQVSSVENGLNVTSQVPVF